MNKVSENFTNIQIKMTDLPVTSPTPADPTPADLDTPAPNQPALLHSKHETLLHSTKKNSQ